MGGDTIPPFLHYEHFDGDTNYKEGKELEWNVERKINPINTKHES
jgi:hypothetical protein